MLPLRCSLAVAYTVGVRPALSLCCRGWRGVRDFVVGHSLGVGVVSAVVRPFSPPVAIAIAVVVAVRFRRWRRRPAVC
eukprot:11155175-Lingulodinium_polyedra.AAC.1